MHGIKVLVRWAIGKRLTNRPSKLSLTTTCHTTDGFEARTFYRRLSPEVKKIGQRVILRKYLGGGSVSPQAIIFSVFVRRKRFFKAGIE